MALNTIYLMRKAIHTEFGGQSSQHTDEVPMALGQHSTISTRKSFLMHARLLSTLGSHASWWLDPVRKRLSGILVNGCTSVLSTCHLDGQRWGKVQLSRQRLVHWTTDRAFDAHHREKQSVLFNCWTRNAIQFRHLKRSIIRAGKSEKASNARNSGWRSRILPANQC